MSKQDKINALVIALTNKFEEKINKITSWTNASDTNYPSAKLVKDSLDGKEDLNNKIEQFSVENTDHDHYPSAQLVQSQLGLKEAVGNKVSAWTGTNDNINYPSEKLVKATLDLKLNASDLPDIPENTSDLINDGSDGVNPFLTEHQTLDDIGGEVELTKETSADSGMAATYTLTQGGNNLGKINIPKDQFVQSASLETVGATPSALETAQSLTTGDKYINMVINTEDNDGDGTTILIPVNELIDNYGADGTTIVLSGGQFSIKTGGVDTTQLANSAVTTAKIADSNVTADKLANNSVTTDKISNGNVVTDKLAAQAVTKAKLANEVQTQWQADAKQIADTDIEDYLQALTDALTPPTAPASGE